MPSNELGREKNSLGRQRDKKEKKEKKIDRI